MNGMEQEIPAPESEVMHRADGRTGPPRDLRQFIATLSDAGRLKRVNDPVHWRLEVGLCASTDNRPTLFEKICEYPGHRLFTNGLCDVQAIALALGLPPSTSCRSLVQEAQRRLANPIQPVAVRAGPILDNLREGKRLSLFDLPVPKWNAIESGRYIGTWHLNVTRDPDTGARNVGVYRMEILGPNTATVSTSPSSHLGRQVARAERQNHALPMAVVIGAPEAAVIAAAAGFPEGMDEFDMSGALLGEPIELLTPPGGFLEVPAWSEIVLEGELEPHVRVPDGPYFDYTGKSNINPRACRFHARRMWFRNQPIFRGAAVGRPGAEDHQVFAFLAELGLVDFHGSRLKQFAQSQLLKRRSFRSFQIAGSLTSYLHRFSSR